MQKDNFESYIYVIDKDYKIEHFNENAKNILPELEIGECCYKTIRGEETPCEDCPLHMANGNRNTVYFNKKLSQWQEVSTGSIDWVADKECFILLVRGIEEGDKNLFYNLTKLSAYDELYEMNLKQNTYKTLYHAPGKHRVEASEGNLEEMLQQVSVQNIYEEDRGRFLDFWNLEKLSKEFSGKHKKTLKLKYRKRKIDNIYNWVMQIVVPLQSEHNEQEILMCFLQELNEQEESDTHDSLTGLMNRETFFTQSYERLKQDGSFCMMAIDIEHFKMFDEWYGYEKGNEFLRDIASKLKKREEEGSCVAGYFGNDDFAILLPNEKETIDQLAKELMEYCEKSVEKIGFYPAIGIYEVEDTSLPMTTIYDRAVIALASVKGNYAERVAYYENRMQEQMEEEHRMLLEFHKALKNDEFTFYIQPKCNMKTGKIVSAESLVRWIHPEKGLILPGKFVPLLEKNGLIGKLDFYIWNSVFSHVKNWIDKNHRAIPISVNLSRVDIFTLDVVECFKQLSQKYQFNRDLVEIEITESAYVEEYEKVKSIIRELREAGFKVLMDDFGSGYSSLNMLKDINVDILKLDMDFLDMSEQSADRGIGILESIVNMAEMVGLGIIAEGVETKEQKDMLLDMGCLYAQGYYFYKPMPIEEFEKVISNHEHVDFRGIQSQQVDYVSIKNLMNYHALDDVELNNILGGVAFYKFDGERVVLQQMNQNYCKILEDSGVDIEKNRDRILDYIYEQDRDAFLQLFVDASKDKLKGASGEIRVFVNNSYQWMMYRIFFLKHLDHTSLFYGQIMNINENKQRDRELILSKKALSDVYDIGKTEENSGYYRCIGKEPYTFAFVSMRFMDLTGYSLKDIEDNFEDHYLQMIHPKDQQQYIAGMQKLLEGEDMICLTYRIRGSYGYIVIEDHCCMVVSAGKRYYQGMIHLTNEEQQEEGSL